MKNEACLKRVLNKLMCKFNKSDVVFKHLHRKNFMKCTTIIYPNKKQAQPNQELSSNLRSSVSSQKFVLWNKSFLHNIFVNAYLLISPQFFFFFYCIISFLFNNIKTMNNSQTSSNNLNHAISQRTDSFWSPPQSFSINKEDA